MTDFAAPEALPLQNQEALQPGATITAHGNNLFAADLRARALDDGVLHDVTDMAREAGFIHPVAVTATIWNDITTIPEAYSHEDVNGRLWDVLWMARDAVRHRSGDATSLIYNLILHVGETNVYPVRLVCHAGDHGEPVVTLSNPETDVFLSLGEIAITHGAIDALVEANESPWTYLARHQRGDWGDLDDEDMAANNWAASTSNRLLSAYDLPESHERIWIITEWDRSITTILLPSEY